MSNTRTQSNKHLKPSIFRHIAATVQYFKVFQRECFIFYAPNLNQCRVIRSCGANKMTDSNANARSCKLFDKRCICSCNKIKIHLNSAQTLQCESILQPVEVCETTEKFHGTLIKKKTHLNSLRSEAHFHVIAKVPN